jgi:hypothetical protein
MSSYPKYSYGPTYIYGKPLAYYVHKDSKPTQDSK